MLLRKRASSPGELRTNRYEPLSTNIVVGSPGTNTPTAPSAKHVTPVLTNSHLRITPPFGPELGQLVREPLKDTFDAMPVTVVSRSHHSLILMLRRFPAL